MGHGGATRTIEEMPNRASYQRGFFRVEDEGSRLRSGHDQSFVARLRADSDDGLEDTDHRGRVNSPVVDGLIAKWSLCLTG